MEYNQCFDFEEGYNTWKNYFVIILALKVLWTIKIVKGWGEEEKKVYVFVCIYHKLT